MLKVPRRIQVGGHLYQIRFNPAVQDDDRWGQVNNRTQTIDLDPDRPLSQRRCVLIHEILHIINNVYANQALEEKTIDAISEGLNQVLPQLGVEFDWSGLECVGCK